LHKNKTKGKVANSKSQKDIKGEGRKGRKGWKGEGRKGEPALHKRRSVVNSLKDAVNVLLGYKGDSLDSKLACYQPQLLEAEAANAVSLFAR
jgi:hypothetical protein